VQLHDIGAEARRRRHRAGLGLDKERHADARGFQGVDRTAQVIGAALHVETTLGGALFALFRHQAAGVWHVPQRDRQHFLG
jgi:hypothetical protein